MKNNSSDFVDKVMHHLESSQLQPTPKYIFVLKQVLVWMGLTLFVFISGHSLGILFYFIFDFDYNILTIILKNSEKRALLLLILMWFVSFMVFFTLAYHKYRQTKRGYKLETIALILVLSLPVAIIGGISYQTRFSIYLDKKMGLFLPYYQPWEAKKINVWMSPAKGMLAGQVKSKENDNQLILVDFTGHVWRVDISEAILRRPNLLNKDSIIKLIGRADHSRFKALEIRPWQSEATHKKRCFEAVDKHECAKSPPPNSQ